MGWLFLIEFAVLAALISYAVGRAQGVHPEAPNSCGREGKSVE
jgi:hypothetical protein